MSDLICVAFKDKDTADRALDELREMQRNILLTLRMRVSRCGKMDGKVRLKQAVNLVSLGNHQLGPFRLRSGAHWSACCFSTLSPAWRWEASSAPGPARWPVA